MRKAQTRQTWSFMPYMDLDLASFLRKRRLNDLVRLKRILNIFIWLHVPQEDRDTHSEHMSSRKCSYHFLVILLVFKIAKYTR